MVDAYIRSKEHAWAPTTIRSERARLNQIAKYVDKDPLSTYHELRATRGAYTVKTMFIRLGDYEKFVRDTDRYRQFMSQYANLFKNSYKKKRVDISFEDAKVRILGIRDPDVQATALYLLRHGLRYHELENIDGDHVLGKGAKLRPLFSDRLSSEAQAPTGVEYARVYRALRKVGLKPHDLRKIFTTQLLQKGLTYTDVAFILGHSNIQTTMRYAQPKKNDELKREIEEALSAK